MATGEEWKLINDAQKEARRRRLNDARERLDRMQRQGMIAVPWFTPWHCRLVTQNRPWVDFWPSSGKWRPVTERRSDQPARYGWSELLKHLGVKDG
jgi:hypothetical protein